MHVLDESVATEIYAGADRLARTGARPLQGVSSSNWLVEHPAVGLVLVRRPKSTSRARLVRAADEAALLGALATRLEFVPRVLHVAANLDQLHEAKPGVTVTSLGSPPPDSLAPIMTDHLARLSEFPLSELPPRLRHRLNSPDVRVFAAGLLDEVAAAWQRAEAAAPGVIAVYTRLGAGPRRWSGIRAAIDRFRWRRPTVVHTDLHTGNVLAELSYEPRAVRSAALVDWERGRIGDPLFDFVRHTISTEYSDDQLDRAVQDYQDKTRPEVRAGIAADWSTCSQLNQARRNAYGTEQAAGRLRNLRKSAASGDPAAEDDLRRFAVQEAERLNAERRTHHEPPITTWEAVEREFRRYVFGESRRTAASGLMPIVEVKGHRPPETRQPTPPATQGGPVEKGPRPAAQGRQDRGLDRTKRLDP